MANLLASLHSSAGTLEAYGRVLETAQNNVSNASTFRGGFGSYGLELADGKLAGLLARAVVVLDADGIVLHSQLVPGIAQEPDYDAAVAALG